MKYNTSAIALYITFMIFLSFEIMEKSFALVVGEKGFEIMSYLCPCFLGEQNQHNKSLCGTDLMMQCWAFGALGFQMWSPTIRFSGTLNAVIIVGWLCTWLSLSMIQEVSYFLMFYVLLSCIKNLSPYMK